MFCAQAYKKTIVMQRLIVVLVITASLGSTTLGQQDMRVSDDVRFNGIQRPLEHGDQKRVQHLMAFLRLCKFVANEIEDAKASSSSAGTDVAYRRRTASDEDDDDAGDGNELPVRVTQRTFSFGNRLEPIPNAPSMGVGSKIMRYGRRRRQQQH